MDIDSYSIPKGLSKGIIRLISSFEEEPDWTIRLNAYEKFLNMKGTQIICLCIPTTD
ncbi:hypothetical protein SLEP1_g26740 [Rubroshorea leprosula]|uniref:Uncharacterized protein n=1 Tax=Rubroshorea leprosula TaxID=152421 RepID=A0AAV5JMW5_9ROSI|nr:hypothetical protein SLEP1_g26740 [Rubroshorea leprosula]